MYEKITHSPQTQTYSFSLCLQTLNSWQQKRNLPFAGKKHKRHAHSLSLAVLGVAAKLQFPTALCYFTDQELVAEMYES